MAKIVIALALIALIVSACGQAPAPSAAQLQKQPAVQVITVVVQATQRPATVPTQRPAPVPTQRPAPVQPADDIAVFARLAEAQGLTYDGVEDCAAGPETEGVWYGSKSGGFDICFGVVNGRAHSIGGFVMLDGDTERFAGAMFSLATAMGWPSALLGDMADKMGAVDIGDHWYGDWLYTIQPTDDYEALMVGIMGPP